MKSNTHPENYRLVAFKDMSNNDVFITKSTVETKETTKIEGVEYPLFKLEISRTSGVFPRFLSASQDRFWSTENMPKASSLFPWRP